jgi:DNA-binding XRE family transcriptional regulator
MITPNVEFIEISFKGSIDKLDDAIKNMLALGFTQISVAPSPAQSDSDTVPWRTAFPEMTSLQENGIVLKETRKLKKLTQKQLADITGIPQRHLSEMETAKRSIGKETAKKLAQALAVNYRLFL